MEPNLSEAERRIEEARRTGADVLDLGDLALQELPASLGELPQLETLYLGRVEPSEQGDQWQTARKSPDFTDLSPLCGLAGLQSLNLGSTGVTDLSPLSGLAGLQSLDLSYCRGVPDLSPLSGLQSLESLNLYDSRASIPVDFLRTFANHARLIQLIADKAIGVPREVLSHEDHDNCLPRLRTYLAELDLASEAENEVKIILLGNGRAGKTQLCRRFRDKPFDKSIQSTHGVQIWREVLRIKTGDQEQIFQVNWWDFGGQDIYHGTHALFLRSRAV